MVKRTLAVLSSVGLIGGVGAVTYGGNGTPTVTVTDTQGKKTAVTLPVEVDGKTYSCPAGTEGKLKPYDENAGRIMLTLNAVRKREKTIEKRYPHHVAPDRIVKRYKALMKRDDSLVKRFNKVVDTRNAILDSDCKA